VSTETELLSGEREHAIEEMLRFMVQSLADRPEDVEVQFVSDEEGEVFEVRANDADLGRLIGKNGQTAKALEAIVNASGGKSGKRYHLDIFGSEDELEDS
jgi:uncharacterized protein